MASLQFEEVKTLQDIKITTDIDSVIYLARSLEAFDIFPYATISSNSIYPVETDQRKLTSYLNKKLSIDKSTTSWHEFLLCDDIYVLFRRDRANPLPSDLRLKFIQALIKPAVDHLDELSNTRNQTHNRFDRSSDSEEMVVQTFKVFDNDWPAICEYIDANQEKETQKLTMLDVYYCRRKHGILSPEHHLDRVFKEILRVDTNHPSVEVLELHFGAILTPKEDEALVINHKMLSKIGFQSPKELSTYSPFQLHRMGDFSYNGSLESEELYGVTHFVTYDPAVHMRMKSQKGSVFSYVTSGGYRHCDEHEKLTHWRDTAKMFLYDTIAYLEKRKQMRQLRVEICAHGKDVDQLVERYGCKLPGKNGEPRLSHAVSLLVQNKAIVRVKGWNQHVRTISDPDVTRLRNFVDEVDAGKILGQYELHDAYDAELRLRYLLEGSQHGLDSKRLTELLKNRDGLLIKSASDGVVQFKSSSPQDRNTNKVMDPKISFPFPNMMGVLRTMVDARSNHSFIIGDEAGVDVEPAMDRAIVYWTQFYAQYGRKTKGFPDSTTFDSGKEFNGPCLKSLARRTEEKGSGGKQSITFRDSPVSAETLAELMLKPKTVAGCLVRSSVLIPDSAAFRERLTHHIGENYNYFPLGLLNPKENSRTWTKVETMATILQTKRTTKIQVDVSISPLDGKAKRSLKLQCQSSTKRNPVLNVKAVAEKKGSCLTASAVTSNCTARANIGQNIDNLEKTPQQQRKRKRCI